MKRMSWGKGLSPPQASVYIYQKSEENLLLHARRLLDWACRHADDYVCARDSTFFSVAKKKYYSRRYRVVNSIRK